MAYGRVAGKAKFGVAKSRQRNKYPDNWNNISKSVIERDGKKCSKCGITSARLQALNAIDGKKRRLEVHHLRSVQTGNNRKTNLICLCSDCHSKQPKHSHLNRR